MVYVRIDRTRKIPITVLLRALNLVSNAEIIDILGESEQVLNTLEKDTTTTADEALVEIYKRLRPGEPPTVDSAKSLITNMFFDPRRYDLAKVGRYKVNKKLALFNRIAGRRAADNIVNPDTGELFVAKSERITRDQAIEIENSGINMVDIILDDGSVVRVVGNNFVDGSAFDLPFSLKDLGLNEKVYYPLMKELMETYDDEEELKVAIEERIKELSPKHITPDDIIASINYEFNLFHGIGLTDDIDHLGNRRLRSVGELLQNQFRIGLSRMERVVRERMTIQDVDVATPQALINIRPVVASLKEFW